MPQDFKPKLLLIKNVGWPSAKSRPSLTKSTVDLQLAIVS